MGAFERINNGCEPAVNLVGLNRNEVGTTEIKAVNKMCQGLIARSVSILNGVH